MNTTVIDDEIQEFLAAVRAKLADLDAEEQRDILDGLEADLTDLVAERGRGALGDPVAYARELRTAAGLEPEMGRPVERVAVSARIHALLDAAHRQWDRLVGAMPGDAVGLLLALRPVWWVLRGWIAVQMAATWLGDWSLTIVPGGELPGVAAVLLGALLSIQLGRGRLWPGDAWRRIAALRVLVVGLNLFALAMIPVVLAGLGHGKSDRYNRGFDQGYQAAMRESRAMNGDKAGVYVDGKWVSNIYPYDAQGRPLIGVQLFNQIGEPINVITQPEYDVCPSDDPQCVDGAQTDLEGNQLLRWFYPWTNGATQLFNVFPIPSRVQAGEGPSKAPFTEPNPPTVGPFPLASVPEVSLPGITPSRQAR
jgi:hypothetical protein